MWRGAIGTGLLFCLAMIIFSCTRPKEIKTITTMTSIVKDPHSYARPEEAIVKHIDLDLTVNFELKQLRGVAAILFHKSDNASHLFLDTKDLNIREIKFENGNQAKYIIHEEDSILGSALEIELAGQEEKVIITYSTGQNAEALQWLSAGQTADKVAPFLFTQSQAILARSWIPLQDSPGIRFTYTASVKVPEGMMALMSAENPQEVNSDGLYHFSMPQPIPSYLMALAVGKIEFAPVGERTGVYAEPGMLMKSHEEFSEMEDMLEIAEKLYGAYRWGRYDLIVLPPSFPFGGMENPRITFATPTILAGDKSLTSLVAHELAHSWSGNLVTNATWNDFWLNEGFTVYFEHRIMEELKGKDYAEMLSALSQQELITEVAHFMSSGQENATKLKLDLAGKNPDDGVNTIAYDKGYFFLRRLEDYVGREKFDAFLNQYFETHAFQSNHTEAFMDYLQKNLFAKNGLKPIDELDEWIYGTGLPVSLPKVVSQRFLKVEQASERWKNGDLSFDTAGWSSHEWVYFIKKLPNNISPESMAQLDRIFQFTQSGNAEILGVWFVHCARQWYEPSFKAMEHFLVHTGRRKFLMPVYGELIKTEQGKAMAKNIYQKARPNYHFVAVNSLDKSLNSGNSDR
jgi:leukotriene-A4 hydrolase